VSHKCNNGWEMATGDEYRVKAADMHARAKDETSPSMQAHYETLALSYLRLADQADRRGAYEHPAQTHPAHPTQQQQQPQNKLKPDGTG
jgi:hypothetical protein